jgi:hypothetical protein
MIARHHTYRPHVFRRQKLVKYSRSRLSLSAWNLSQQSMLDQIALCAEVVILRVMVLAILGCHTVFSSLVLSSAAFYLPFCLVSSFLASYWPLALHSRVSPCFRFQFPPRLSSPFPLPHLTDHNTTTQNYLVLVRP